MESHGLDAVIDELKNRGIKAGEEEAGKIVEKAKAEAADIVAKAKKEAEQLADKAKSDAAATKRQMEAELKASAQVALTAFRQAMEKSFLLPEIDASLKPVISAPTFLENAVSEMVRAFAGSEFKEGGISVLLPAQKQKELEASVVQRLKARAGPGVQVKFDDGFQFGFKVGPADGRFQLDLSEDGFRDIFVKFMSPRFREFFATQSGQSS